MGLVAPLGELVQLDGEMDQVSCRTNPGVFGVQEMTAWPGAPGAMVSVGAPLTCTAAGNTQNPPVSENWPLVIGPPASGCPMVPLMEYWPFVLVPPPPATLYQSIE